MISIQEPIYGNICQSCFGREDVKEIKIRNEGGGVIIRLCANCRAELAENLAEPKKGHWVMKYRHRKSVRHVKGYDAYDVEREIELVEETEGYEPYCSECGAAAAESFLCFCPKCGADMRESIKKDGEHE